MSLIGAIFCFGISTVSTIMAIVSYALCANVRCDVLAETHNSILGIAQRYTMIAGFFAWFGFNILAQ